MRSLYVYVLHGVGSIREQRGPQAAGTAIDCVYMCAHHTTHAARVHCKAIISVCRGIPKLRGTAADCAHMGAHRITYPARVHCKANVKQH